MVPKVKFISEKFCEFYFVYKDNSATTLWNNSDFEMRNSPSVYVFKQSCNAYFFYIQTNNMLFDYSIDLSLYEWNFDLDMPGQKFHHSLKEHHKISNILKFRWEML
jgi:hypothetical protein